MTRKAKATAAKAARKTQGKPLYKRSQSAEPGPDPIPSNSVPTPVGDSESKAFNQPLFDRFLRAENASGEVYTGFDRAAVMHFLLTAGSHWTDFRVHPVRVPRMCDMNGDLWG